MQTTDSRLLSLLPHPQNESVFRLLACSLPGPRRRPPTQHKAACYSSVCPPGAWTLEHRLHLTLGQSCLLLSVVGMSLVAFGFLHRSSVCMETMMLPSTCERKANMR